MLPETPYPRKRGYEERRIEVERERGARPDDWLASFEDPIRLRSCSSRGLRRHRLSSRTVRSKPCARWLACHRIRSLSWRADVRRAGWRSSGRAARARLAGSRACADCAAPSPIRQPPWGRANRLSYPLQDRLFRESLSERADLRILDAIAAPLGVDRAPMGGRPTYTALGHCSGFRL